jgi:DNA-binding beta-propeller fold protein YncE
MSIDARGRRAAQTLRRDAERRGPAPDLGVLRRRARRRAAGRTGLATLAVVVAVAVAWQGLIFRPDRAPAGSTAGWPGVAGLDRRVRDAVPTGRASGTDVAAASDAVWVLNRSQPSGEAILVRVDPATDRVVARIAVGPAAVRVAAADGSVWVLRSSPTSSDLVQVDPATNRVARTVSLGNSTRPAMASGEHHLLVAGGAVWVMNQAGILRVDPGSGRVTTVMGPDRYGPLSGLAAAGGSVWAVAGMVVQQIRPQDGTIGWEDAPKELGSMIPSGLAAGAGALWVVGTGFLARVDPDTRRVVATFRVGHGVGTAADLIAGDERTVVARGNRVLYLIDPAANRVRAEVPLPSAGAVAVGAGAIWVTDQANGRLLRVEG